MHVGIIRLFAGECGKIGYYNVQELGLAKALTPYGIKVTVFLLSDKKISGSIKINEISNNISVAYIPGRKIGSHGFINPTILEDFKLDVLHIISDIQLSTSRLIKWGHRKSIPVITHTGTIISDSANSIKRFLTSQIFNYNKLFLNGVTNIAKTPFVYDEMKKMNVKNLHMIPVGLDTDLVKDKIILSKIQIREQFGIPLHAKVLVFIGRLEEYKNPLFSVNILEHLCKDDSNYVLLLVGKGPLKENIIRTIKDKKLEENFVYIEEMQNSDIWKAYTAGDIFINLNPKEIYGMCILEAMYYRCPVVAVNAPGPSYIIDHEKNGYLVPDFKLEHWEAGIKNAFLNKESYGQNSYDKISYKLSWEAIVKDYLSLYEKLLGLKIIK